MKIYPTFLLAALACLSTLSPAQTAKLKVRGSTQYIMGTNLAWLDTRYGTDFGLYPLHPEWGNGYNSTHVDNYLKDMKNMNLNVVRVWLCEDLDGFTFDSSGNATGLSTLFLTNLDDMVARANTYKMALYFTFFNGNDVGTAWNQVLPSGAHIQNFIDNSTSRTAVINNVIGALATRYNGNAAVFGYDLINESNIGSDLGYYTWANMRTFGSAAASKIHANAPGTQVTMSTQWLQAFDPGNFAGSYGGLGFDFYDMHQYGDNPTVENTTSMGADKPVLLGEYGPSTKTDAGQNTNATQFLSQTASKGWAGSLQWAYEYPGASDGYQLINANASWRPVCTTLYNYGCNLATFTGSATCAANVNRGAVLAISSTINCTGFRMSNSIADFEIYNSSNVKVAQTWTTGVDFYKGDSKVYPWNWTVPANLPTGTYHIAVAANSQNWGINRLWVGSAATFVVH